MPLRREPPWLREGDPDDHGFLNREDLPCRGQSELYFSDAAVDVARCKNLCQTCPVFEDCARFGLTHFGWIPYGTLFGVSEHDRLLIHKGKRRFSDWRSAWGPSLYARAVAKARTNEQERQRREEL
jgi:hypothetical protein